MIKAVLFDLDGTLLNRSASIEPFLRSQLGRLGNPGHKSQFSQIHSRFLEIDGFGYTPRLDVYQTLISEFGLEHDADKWVHDHHVHFSDHSVTFPGVKETLTELRTQKYKLGMVTNGSFDGQWAKIAAVGLDQFFDTIVISEREGIKKPDPAIYKLAADRLGADIAKCIFVGDHPAVDILGAQAVGITGVWLRGDFAWPCEPKSSPDYTIERIPDLLTLLPEIEMRIDVSNKSS